MEFSEYLRARIDFYENFFSSIVSKHSFTNILVRYSEIGTKSRSVQKRMVESTIESIKLLLKKVDIEPTRFYQQRGRLIFSFHKEDIKLATIVLIQIPGIASISPVIKTSTRINNVVDRVTEYLNIYFRKGMEIGIKIRIKNHEVAKKYKPEDIAILCYDRFSKINDSFSKDDQNLGTPDLKINVEIRKNFSYVYSHEISGLHSGLPVENQRASVAMSLNRFHDIDAFIQICERGQHIIPVLFQTKENVKYMNIYSDLLSGVYPAEEFYIITVDLSSILEIIKEKLQVQSQINANINFICHICRYIRYSILENFIHNQIFIIRNSLMKQSTRISGLSNILYQIPNYSSDKHHKIKKSNIKTRYIRGIVDGEQDSIYCPYNENSWNSSAQYGTPVFYPLLVRSEDQIRQHLFDLIVVKYYQNFLRLEEDDSVVNRTEQIKLKSTNERLRTYGVEITNKIGNKICKFKQPLSDGQKGQIWKMINTFKIDDIIKKALEDIELIRVI